MNPLLIRRIGGVVLMVAGFALLVGPVGVLIGGIHVTAEKARDAVLDALIWQISVGVLLAVLGAYFLTKKPPAPKA
jgi:hypothetical protein